MNAGRDVERLIADWLVEEAVTGAPDRILYDVRRSVAMTPQRRLGAGWRTSMNTTMTRLAALAAGVALAVVGLLWLNRPPDPNVGVPSPSPAATAPEATTTATPSATSTPTLAATQTPGPISSAILDLPPLGAGGVLTPGRYRIADPFQLTVFATFPTEGWAIWGATVTRNAAAFYKRSFDPPGVGVMIMKVDNLYANPCSKEDGLLDPALGPSVDDFVAAIAAQPGTQATTPTDVTIAGYNGKHLEYSFTGVLGGCNALSRWSTESGDRVALSGEHDELWVLDVAGERWVIDLFSFPTSSQADIAEALQIVAGLVIEP